MANQEILIEAKALVKRYGDFTAVNGIDFQVRKGESFGFLGPNGAGKSTTMRIIAATLTRTSGDISILGKDPEKFGPEIKAHLGVVPQTDNLDNALTVEENLYIYGRYFGLSKRFIKPKIEELLDFAQLVEKRLQFLGVNAPGAPEVGLDMHRDELELYRRPPLAFDEKL